MESYAETPFNPVSPFNLMDNCFRAKNQATNALTLLFKTAVSDPAFLVKTVWDHGHPFLVLFGVAGGVASIVAINKLTENESKTDRTFHRILGYGASALLIGLPLFASSLGILSDLRLAEYIEYNNKDCYDLGAYFNLN